MDENFYVNLRLTSKEMDGHVKYLKPYLDAVERRMPNKESPLLEVGIGTGAGLSYFDLHGYVNSFGVDNNRELIKRFRNELAYKFRTKARVKYADAFDLSEIKNLLGRVDCIYHQGLLEHFSDEDVDRMINHHIEITSGYVIFAVPIEGYSDNGDYDPDEVHYPLEWWMNKLNKFVIYEYGVFGVDVNKHQAYFVISGHYA